MWKREDAHLLEQSRFCESTSTKEISSILNNWDDATNAYADAMDSAGVATEAQSTYMESLNAKIEQFNASVQELYYDFLDSDLVAGVVEFGTAFIQTIDKIIDSIGSLSTALIAVLGGSALNTVFKAFRNLDAAGGNFVVSLSNMSKSFSAAYTAFNAAMGSSVMGSLGANALGSSSTGVFGALGQGVTAFVSSLSPLTKAIAGVAVAVGAVTAYQNWQEELRKEADEASTAWGESNDSLEDYKDRITELKTALDNGTLSEEEAYEAKSELLSIQESLSESYGSQAEGLDLVNGELQTQLDLMDEISRNDAVTYLADYDGQIDKATKRIEGFNAVIGTFGTSDLDSFNKIIEGYEDYFNVEAGTAGVITVTFEGNAEDAEEVLGNLKSNILNTQDELDSANLFSSVYDGANDALEYANEVLEDYQNTYKRAQEAAVIADTNLYRTEAMSESEGKTVANWLADYAEAVENYNEALSSGDTTQLKLAREDFEEINAQVEELTGEGGDLSGFARQFDEITDALDTSSINLRNFKDAIEEAISEDVEDDLTFDGENAADLFIRDFTRKLQKEGMSDFEFKATVVADQGAERTSSNFYRMAEYADEAGISLDELAQILVDLGVLSGTTSEELDETTNSLEKLFSTSDENTFNDTVDNFQSDVDDIQSTLDSIRNGEEVNLMDTIQGFDGLEDYVGDLSNGTADLESALEQLQLDKIYDFSDAWAKATEGLEGADLDAINKLFVESMSQIDFAPYVDEFRTNYEEYSRLVKEASELELDLSQTTFGNIDMDVRDEIKLTEDSIDSYRNALESWGESADDMIGEVMTVFGAWGTFGEEEIPIAFSPILQTDNGAELLTKEVANTYIESLLDEMKTSYGEEGFMDELLALDARGIDVSGYGKIQGLIADIGDTAEKTAKSMHYLGEEGAINMSLQELGIQGDVADQLIKEFGDNEYAMEAIVMLSMNPDAANWDYEQFVAQIEDSEVYINLRITEDSLAELQTALDGLEEEQDLIESSQSLSEAMNIKKTTKDYKDLINNSKKQVSNLKSQNDLLKVQEGLYKDLGRDTAELESQINSNQKAINSALEDQISWNNEALALNYNQAAEGIDAIRTALSEAASDTLLSSDSISNLISTFSDLDDFDATEVFHQTADGVDLNTTALKHLEDEYVALKKQDYQSQLAELGKEYQDAQKYLQNYTDDLDKMSAAEKDAILAAAGYRGLSDIESDITYVDLLSNELDGLTSAYQTWINAQSQGSYADAFQSMGDYYSTAEDLINRGWIGNEGLNAYLDLMLSADQRTGDVATDFEKLTQTIEGTDHSLMDYFQYDENGNFVNDGIYDFMDDVIATMGDAYARLDEETGQYEFGAWSNEDVQALADRFGTSTDFIWKMIDAMREAGFEIQTTEDYIQDAINAANVDTQTLQDLQAEGKLTEKIDVDYDVEELSADEIEDKLGELDELEHELFVDFDMGEIDWDTYMEALSELEALRDSLNGQDVRIRVEEEIEEGNLQELDEIISQGEYEEEIALRFGIDTSEEGWQDEVHAIAQVIQEEAEAERIEMTVESKIEETGMTAEELSNEIDGLSNQEILDYFKVEGDASEAEAIIEYINEQAESEKTWDMTVKIDDEQFEQLAQQQEGTVDINADTSEAMGTVEEFIQEVEGMEATIQITTSSSGGEESTETSGSLPAADGTVNYTVGEYPTEIEEPASGTVDYEVGEYPTTIEEHASSVVDYEVGEYPTTIEEHASGIADYEVGDYPKDIPVNADVNNAETAISGLKAEIESIDATISVNVDTETLASQLGELNSYLPTEGASVDVTANVSGTEDVNALTNAIGVLTGKVVQVIAQVTGEGAVNSLRNSIGALVGKVVQVIAQVTGQASVDALRNSIAAVQSKTVTVTSVSKTVNEAMGTAHAEGTTIMNTWNNYRHSIGAYANGTRQNWALPRNETALTNETGQESIVRDGQWMLLPGGAHFEDLKRGDIVNKRAFIW